MRSNCKKSITLVPLDAGMTILSAHLDFDLSQIPLDADMTERTEPELHRMRTVSKTDGSGMTLREVAHRHGQGGACPSSSAR